MLNSNHQVQNKAFGDEVQLLKDVKARQQAVDQDTSKDKIKTMKRLSSLYKLDPFLDEDGLLRVGGQLRQSSVPYEVKHSVILLKKGHVTNLVLCHYHKFNIKFMVLPRMKSEQVAFGSSVGAPLFPIIFPNVCLPGG